MSDDIDAFIISCIAAPYIDDDPYVLNEEEIRFLEQKYEIYAEITRDFDIETGQKASKKDREEIGDVNLADETLTYGEFDFFPLGEVFFTIKHRYDHCLDGVFYDLGSGTGKPVISAALLGDFDCSIGIELLKSLHDMSIEIKGRYDILKYPTQIHMIHGDIFDQDISNASIILANSTCYSHEMILKFGSICLKPGTLAISLSKALPSSA